MRQNIETAPRDRKTIIIEDKLTGTTDFAHWSPEGRHWVREDGELSKVAPTHWYPIPDELRFARVQGNIVEEEDRAAFELLLGNTAAEAEYPVSSPLLQVSPVGRGSTAFAIAVLLVAATLIGFYFEFAASERRYPHLGDIYRTVVHRLFGRAGDASIQPNSSEEAATAELQQERQRTAAVAGELATARREFDTKLASLGKAGDETARLKKIAETATAELQQERQRTAALTHSLDIAQRAIEARTAPEITVKGQKVQTKPIAESTAPEQPAASTTKGDAEAARLTTRASALIAQGNIGAARTVLEQAVEMGSAKASFALAETYDPRILSGWRTYGTRGDASKAREFYARAVAGGIEGAKDRLNSLRQ
jgi:hypothetical protein